MISEHEFICSAFAIDDDQNQFLADFYGIVMGTRFRSCFVLSQE